MPTQYRSAGRNVHLFDTNDRGTSIGGLILTAGVTNANLYAMVEILVFFDSEYVLRNENDTTVEKDNTLLLPGNYYVDAPRTFLFTKQLYTAKLRVGPFVVNNETVLVRTISSSSSGPRVSPFRDAVRARDRRCIITRVAALGAQYGNWRSFEAAYIFPLAYVEHWTNNDFARWISAPPVVGGSINSVQNGLLLRSNIHDLFDSYEISINPDVCILYSLLR